MFIASFATGSFAANCYVLATGAGQPAVVVDPGQDAYDTVVGVCGEHGLTPVAVVATHGHLDHVRDVAAVGRHWQVPCWIDPADRHLLADPYAGLPADWAPLVAEALSGIDTVEPDDVRDLSGSLDVAGLQFGVEPAPGHTPGSVVLRLAVAPDVAAGASELVLTGDVIFAGAVGRTDLPGSDPAAMRDSLRRLCEVLPDDAVLLPGHGDATTMAAERQRNPYLVG